MRGSLKRLWGTVWYSGEERRRKSVDIGGSPQWVLRGCIFLPLFFALLLLGFQEDPWAAYFASMFSVLGVTLLLPLTFRLAGVRSGLISWLLRTDPPIKLRLKRPGVSPAQRKHEESSH
jgi:hypothetical protein